jgi:translocation and assembly module TamB
MMFEVSSSIDLPKMREIFFHEDDFTMTGEARFDGLFHLFRETLPDGELRNGRELKGDFAMDVAHVNDYRFDDVRGFVRWTPDRLEVSDGATALYGGRAEFDYLMAPFGQPEPAIASFDARYECLDLETLTDALELSGLRLDGCLSGRNLLEWPLGRYAEHTGEGVVRVQPPRGVTLMSRETSVAAPQDGQDADQRLPIAPLSLDDPVGVGGEMAYRFGPDRIDLGPSRLATDTTLVEFEGETFYGERSRIPFHVSSADWQEGDRLLAGILTAFGSTARPIPIGGSGTFDGVMTGSFSAPRIEGDFVGDRIRAWDVTWGSVRGAAVIEDSYVDVTGVEIVHGDSSIRTAGRFSIGYPRSDGGAEIDAVVEIAQRPVGDLRHAFTIDDYDIDGTIEGEFHIYGSYLSPGGFGKLTIRDGVAYGEPFEQATADVRLEGEGARLLDITASKGGGAGTGSAFIDWDGNYSFTFNARGIPVESFATLPESSVQLSGLVDFDAGGSGDFAAPRYDVRGTLRDFFVADEGIGQVRATLNIDGDRMTMGLVAASPRLAVSVDGTIALEPGYRATLAVGVTETSLDPYVRVLQPRLSPFTTAVASGSIRVDGTLADLDGLTVDATIDRLDMRLFDYPIRNDGGIRVALDRRKAHVSRMVIVGEDTRLEVAGDIDFRESRIDLATDGDANLAVLQGFFQDIRSSGMVDLNASLAGPLDDPVLDGTFSITDGRIRHFDLPHSLDELNGEVEFDSRGVSLDGLRGRLADGDVVFGGRIDKQGYLPSRLDVTISGADMRPRLMQGMETRMRAQLALRGTMEAAVLSGQVIIDDAQYRRAFSATGGLLDLAGGEDGTASPPAPAVPTIPLSYDVRIIAPSTLHVRNSVILTASADLELLGTYDRPLLFGRVEASRGEALFEGRRYLLRRGVISFNNPTRIEPFLDVEVQTPVRVPGDTYRITVRAVGPWPDPVIEFDSDPPLSEAQLLALLFADVVPGQAVEFRAYSNVTAEQQLVQERAARELTDAIFSSELGRAVEETFGVDSFQLTPSLGGPDTQSARLDPGARVRIGKRLSDRLWVTYSRSLSASTRDQVILLEYDQTDRFSWILSRNEDRTYALELQVRRTF